jgi:hypothetical protein
MQLVPHPPLGTSYVERFNIQSPACLQVPIVFVDRLFGKSKLGGAEILVHVLEGVGAPTSDHLNLCTTCSHSLY